MRDVNGLKLIPSDFSIADKFSDGRFDVSINIIIANDAERNSTSETLFHGEVDLAMSKYIIDSSWSYILGDRNTYKNNIFNIKGWYDAMIIAEDIGLTISADNAFATLQKVLK